MCIEDHYIEAEMFSVVCTVASILIIKTKREFFSYKFNVNILLSQYV